MSSNSIDPRTLILLYTENKHENLSECLLKALDFFGSFSSPKLTKLEHALINSFLETFLFLLTKEDYVISKSFASRFIENNPTISNIVAISVFKTTDSHLELVRNQKNGLIKILTLLSPRNTSVFNSHVFFNQDPALASIWYSVYYKAVSGPTTKLIYNNLNIHQAELDERWRITKPYHVGSPYYLSTYVNPDTDKIIKTHINKCIKKTFNNTLISNIPDRKRIVILSARWSRGNAVYRTCARFVESLRPDYDLTLIQLKKERTDFDKSLFTEIHCITMNDIRNNELGVLSNNDFMLAYFPDIGMQIEDQFLSNLRFAPIQIMGYGHPVSTWGGEIDYVIGGQETEIKEKVRDFYSERLILLPEIGAIHNLPCYEHKGFHRTTNRIIVNCAWSAQKCNYPHLLSLAQIIERAKSKPLFRFFQGTIDRFNSFIPFESELKELLGPDNVEVYPGLPYEEYMSKIEEGDFAIDSSPFGGSNTIVDSLWLGKPVVTIEGERFFNRAPAALLRKVGLDDLIARSSEEFIEYVVRLIDDAAWRNSLQNKLLSVDLEKKIFDPSYAAYFKKAIDYLIENHEILKVESSHEPIFIK